MNLINSDLSIITNIELDHEKWLGSSLENIGNQKAAILKKGKLAILGSDEMPTSGTTKATKICSSHYQLNKDFFIRENKSHWSYSFSEKNCNLDLLSVGSLNTEAAASAITAHNLLSDKEVEFQSIIENTQLKGRCDIVNNFILDVSHNPASVKNLISFIEKNFKERKFKAIFASMSEKDSSSIIKEIAHLISEWNICLIDDDQNILASLSLTLKSEGYNIKTFSDGLSGLTSLQEDNYDIAILDIKMPRLDGLEVLQELRQTSNLPVIFLTSKDEEIDELLGLKLGADDFVKKSGGFSIKVLIERIRVQLRKKDSKNILEENKSLISHGRLKLDPSQLECEWNGESLPDKLTTTEFLIVKELAKRPGIIKERAQLMDIAYREDTDIEDRTIDSHVKRIRKKFKKVDPDFSAIETRYGSGYRWNVS